MKRRVYAKAFYPMASVSSVYRKSERFYNRGFNQETYNNIIERLKQSLAVYTSEEISQLIGISVNSLIRIIHGKCSPSGPVLVGIVETLKQIGYGKDLFE